MRVYCVFHAQLEHTSEEQFKKAVETLRTANQEERVELAQTVERTAEKALSTLAAENQKYVDAESRQLQSVMSQVKEDLTAHATEVRIPTLYATVKIDWKINIHMYECLHTFNCICRDGRDNSFLQISILLSYSDSGGGGGAKQCWC